MKTVLALAALAFLASVPGASTSAQAGIEAPAAYAASRHRSSRRAGKRRRILPSSTRHPGGRCGQLNLERARLYGLCR